jgi:hypothetical protein
MDRPRIKYPAVIKTHLLGFHYNVVPGWLQIDLSDNRTAEVEFRNLTGQDFVLHLPAEVFGAANTTTSLPARGGPVIVPVEAAAPVGVYEYQAKVKATDIQAKGASRPDIIIVR